MKYLITLPAVYLWIILLCSAKAAPVHARHYPVTASLGGVEFSTTVDSASAQQLLTGGDSPHSPTTLAELRQTLSCHSLAQLPDRQTLRELSRTYSADTAMTLLVECLLQHPQVSHAQQLFLSELARAPQGAPTAGSFLSERKDEYIVVFVPGWGYVENAQETGADLLLPRQMIESQGFETLLVPLQSNGSVEDGADILAQTLRPLLLGEKKIILFSASSGGPIVTEALSKKDIGSHPLLSGWLNICGVLHGSPVIDKLLHWPANWILRGIALFEGWKYQNLISLSREHGISRRDKLNLPQQLTVINYVGTPLSGQVSDMGRFFYELLKNQGPNDGLTYITEAIAPGYTVLGIGGDHFIMQDPALEAKITAFMPTMLRLIEQ